ncbi:MAG: hypothetical protein U0163_19005 [Gemmatimonadaceae bacterium]
MSRHRGAALLLASVLLPPRSVKSQGLDSTWKVSGYLLSLYTQSTTIVPPRKAFALDLNRFRLKIEGKPTAKLAVDVQYDNEVLLGSYLKTTQYSLTKHRAETTFDLQRDYATRSELVARHGLYRATVTWSGASTDVKVGRQRIPLGTGFFWSPMDLLNPIDPTRLERDFRTGADAVLVEEELGAVGRFSMMFTPASERSRSSAAGYLHGNVLGTDYSVLAGRARGDDVLGADFSTARGGLGIRGEATLTRVSDGTQFGRGLLGADYGFTSSLNVTGEAYYNGRGTGDPARYDFASVLTGRALNVARFYGAVAVTYELTPLVKLAAYGVVNLDDWSSVLWPKLEWSVGTNLDIVAGAQRFRGRSDSEYGRIRNLAHVEVRWFF